MKVALARGERRSLAKPGCRIRSGAQVELRRQQCRGICWEVVAAMEASDWVELYNANVGYTLSLSDRSC